MVQANIALRRTIQRQDPRRELIGRTIVVKCDKAQAQSCTSRNVKTVLAIGVLAKWDISTVGAVFANAENLTSLVTKGLLYEGLKRNYRWVRA